MTDAVRNAVAMRIWLDPGKLNSFKLTPADVAAAVRSQNVQVAAGQLGGLPAVQGQQLNATISAQGRLQTPAQFESIVLRTDPSGATVRLRDVARVELGSENYAAASQRQALIGLAVRCHRCQRTRHRRCMKAKTVSSNFFPRGLKAVVALTRLNSYECRSRRS